MTNIQKIEASSLQRKAARYHTFAMFDLVCMRDPAAAAANQEKSAAVARHARKLLGIVE
jgi:hypothetical protein